MADPNAFTGAALDRAADARRRDADWVAARRADPAARAVIAGTAGVGVHDGRLALVPLADAGARAEDALLLGLDGDGPIFAVDEDPPAGDEELPPLVGAGGRRGEPPVSGGPDRVALREAAAVLSQAEGGLVAYAAALVNWHRRHRRCSNCGSATEVGEAGLTRRCPRCGAEHHPRTDPVVIMLVTDSDRVLLGRQPSWPARRYSALAGFVGPGESLEEAVAREVYEEARVRVGAPVYVASQPWPFPASLMLGFTVPWAAGQPDATDDELQDARWFTREQIAAAAHEDADDGWGAPGDGSRGAGRSDGPLLLPPRLAIARRLIEGWLEGG